MDLDIIKNIAVVGAGSFIGGVARYLVSVLMKDDKCVRFHNKTKSFLEFFGYSI